MPRIDITWEQARLLGIARCECGHPKNNHFEHPAVHFGDKVCARCNCQKLREGIYLPNPKPLAPITR